MPFVGRPWERREAADHDSSRSAEAGLHDQMLPRLDGEGEAGLVEAWKEASCKDAERAAWSEGAGPVSSVVNVAKRIDGLILDRPVVTVDAQLPRAPDPRGGTAGTPDGDASPVRLTDAAGTARRGRPTDAGSAPTCVARRARIPVVTRDTVGRRVPDAGAETVAAARAAQIDRGATWRSGRGWPARGADSVSAGVTDRALVAVIAQAALRGMHAIPGTVAHIVRADVAVVRTPAAGVFWPAGRRAAVPIEDVAVVALFAGVDDTVAAVAAGERPARGERTGTVERAGEAGTVWGNAPFDREARTEGLGVAARRERARGGGERAREGHRTDESTGAGDGQG